MTDWDLDYLKQTIPMVLFILGLYLFTMGTIDYLYLRSKYSEPESLRELKAKLTPAEFKQLQITTYEALPLESI